MFKIPNKPYALPSKYFRNSPNEYTWEDWEVESKKKYPIRYFLSEYLPYFYRVRIEGPISNFFYWLKSNTYKKQHLLDLRQPYNDDYIDYYRWGYIDEEAQLLYASFNILVNYVNARNKSKYFDSLSKQNIKKLEKKVEGKIKDKADDVEYYREKLESDKNIFKLYNYWTVDRKLKQKSLISTLSDWSKNRLNDKFKNDKTRLDNLKKCEDEFDNEETEMLQLLISIRKSLWL